MASLADLFVRILPDDAKVNRSIATIKKDLTQIDRTKVQPKIEMSDADRSVAALQAKMASLSKTRIKLGVDSTLASGEINTLQRQLARLTAHRETVPVHLQEGVDAEIRTVRNDLEKLTRKQNRVPLRVERITDQINAARHEVDRTLASHPVEVPVEIDRSHLAGTLDNVGKQVEHAGRDTGRKFSGAFNAGIRSIVGVAAMLVGVSEAINFLKTSNQEAREAQKVGAVTNQVIKATGGAAKISADGVGQLATALSVKNGVDDEAIQQGANLLLTFKSVRNEAGKGSAIFDRATQAATDLSATGFGSITSASKQLGKALNDPVKGTTALARAGVQFTDQQKDQIAQLVKSGDVLGAQKIILGEVESQVGGVAAASATMGEKAKVAGQNFQEQLGTALLPLIDRMATFMVQKGFPALSGMVSFLSDKIPKAFHAADQATAPFRAGIARIFESLKGGGGGNFLAGIQDQFKAFVGFIQAEVVPRVSGISDAFKDLGRVIGPIAMQIGRAIREALAPSGESSGVWEKIKDTIVDALTFIRVTIETVTKIISAVWKEYGDEITFVVKSNWSTIRDVVKGALDIISGILKTATALMSGDWAGAWEGIKQATKGNMDATTAILRGLGNILKTVVGAAWSGVVTTVQHWTGLAVQAVSDKWGQISGIVLGALTSAGVFVARGWEVIRNATATAMTAVWNAIKGGVNLWLTPLKVAFTIIGTIVVLGWGLVSKVTSAVWGAVYSKVIAPVWAQIKGAFRAGAAAVTGAASALWGRIRGIFSSAWNAVYSKVIAPVWARIRSAFSSAMSAIRSSVSSFMGALRSIISSAWSAVHSKIIVPVWNRIRGAFTSAQDSVRSRWDSFWGRIKSIGKAAMDAVHRAVSTVLGKIKNAFSTAVGNIGTAWARVKGKVSDPITWVKNHVYNSPLVPVWNRVAGLVGGPKLKRYARGGMDDEPYGVRPGYTPGRDTHLIAVSGGEPIMRPEWGRAVGKDYVDQANRVARTRGVAGVRQMIRQDGISTAAPTSGSRMAGVPGLAGGGIPGFKIGGIVGKAVSAIGNLVKKIKGWALGGLKTAANKVFGGIRRTLNAHAGGPPGNGTVAKIGNKALDNVLSKIGSEEDKKMAALAAVAGPGGGLLGGNGGHKMSGGIISIARSFHPSYIAGHRDPQGGPAYDIGSSGAKNNAIANALRANHGRLGLRYVISQMRIASARSGWRWRRYSPITGSGDFRHVGHVHVSYPTGGVFPGGKTIFDRIAGHSGVQVAPKKMADGGIVRGGRGGVLAHVGEGRHDELVTPLPKGWKTATGRDDASLDRLIRVIEERGLNGPSFSFGDVYNPREEALSQTINAGMQRVAALGLI